jgi:hypothetical protein
MTASGIKPIIVPVAIMPIVLATFESTEILIPN